MSTPIKTPPLVNTTQDPGLEYLNQREIEVAITPTDPPTNGVVYEEVTQVITNVFQVNAPIGANGQIQFNQGGTYIGDAELQYDPNTDTLTTGTIIANSIRITGNTSSLNLSGGNNYDVLRTDGNGNLSWANVFPSVAGKSGKFLVTNGVSIDWSTSNYNSFATTTYVSNAIANLVGTAPAMLDTLGEIANIIGQTNDPQYGIISQLANKANISNLSQVAFSGSYADLSNRPNISTVGSTGNYSDLNSKPTIPASILDLGISDGTVGQVLTTRGNGTYHFTTVTSGSNANIGNIGFSNTIIYSNTGTVINNSDLNNGQTAGLVIPAQGDGNTSALFNTYGNVTILAGNIGNSQPVQAWTFNPAGALFFPQTPYVTSAILVNDTNQELSVSTDRGNISIWPENSKWLFGSDGNLTLPTGGDILDSTGNSVLGGGFSGNYSDLTNKPNLSVYATAANLSTLSNSVANITWANLSGAPTIPTSFSNLVNGSKTVSLGSDGNLTLPGNTFAVNYANGTQVSIGGGSGNTGNVTFDDNIVIGTGDEYGGDGLFLATGPNGAANLQYLRLRGGDAPTHIHLDTGNNAFYDQYFGNDNKFVKLEAGDTGNVVIGTDDANGNSYNWSFTSDGNLILADGNSVIQSIANSSLDPVNPNVSTMVLTPDPGYGSQALVLDPTTTGHIHLRAPGANIDEPSANIFLGGEDSSFEVGYYDGAAPNVFVHSGGNTWTFGTDGILTFPGNLVIAGNTSVFGIDAALITPAPDLPLIALSAGANGSVSSLWIEDPFNVGTSNIAAVYANPISGSKIVRIAVGQNGVGSGPNLWDFGTDGNLSIPGNINFSGDASAAPSLNDFFSVTSAANFAIVTDNANADHTWTFGANGNLTAPGNISVTGNITAGNLIGNISITGNVTGTSANVTLVAGAYSTVFDNTGAATFPGNITTSGNISATGSILSTPAWTSAGAITFTATTTSPTKGTTTSDNISYRQLGAKQWEIILTYIQTVANGVSGSGDYLVTLPNSLSFDTTLPSQQITTTNIGTNTYALMSYIIPSGSGLINNDSLGGQVYPIVYDATKFRILTTSWGSAIQCWGSGYYSLGGDDPKIQLTFRFTST